MNLNLDPRMITDARKSRAVKANTAMEMFKAARPVSKGPSQHAGRSLFYTAVGISKTVLEGRVEAAGLEEPLSRGHEQCVEEHCHHVPEEDGAHGLLLPTEFSRKTWCGIQEGCGNRALYQREEQAEHLEIRE